MDIKIDLSKTGIGQTDRQKLRPDAQRALEKLRSGTEPFSGWVRLPQAVDREELMRLLDASRRIQAQCDLLVVVGIGGSYLGARAAITALPASAGVHPEIRFAGYNLSGTYHAALLDEMEKREVCLCVISKSGTTTEPSVAFALLKGALVQKYGREEAAKRIFAITDASKGVLREEVCREGYESFVVPDDIGGRYSVLTPVGLLPIAAAGIDVAAMLKGAEAAAASPAWEQDAADYAISRYMLLQSGKTVEVLAYYEPQLWYVAEWLKQLFGESEGKEGKGLFPASLSFSADLHSMGQFLQEGNQIFFETVLRVVEPDRDVVVPESAGGLLAGKSMNAINLAALNGVIAAHAAVDIPIVRIDIPALTPYYFGQLVYFFEMTSAITGMLMGVNPFDQPGVERYKEEMRKELEKLPPCAG